MRAGLTILLLLLLANLTASQTVAEKLLQSLQDKFNTLNDLSANVIQSVNGKSNFEGRVYYKKENKLRLEFKNMLIISDGETNWNYNPKDNKVIISNYEENDSGLLSIKRIVFEYPKECILSTQNIENKTVLELIPKGSTFNFNSIKLWLTDDYMISRSLIDDPAIGLIQLDITNYDLNRGIPDSKFNFTPPEGSKIIDLR